MNRYIAVVQDPDGNNIVIINDIRFKGKRAVDWDDVKSYLERYVGEFYKIASTDRVVYIGKDFPDEYTGSKYTYSLRGTRAKAKANAAQGIPEMLEISNNESHIENKEEKHNRDAKFGWYRYETRFALPVYDEYEEIDHFNVFHAAMIIRHANDGKLYLYDVMEIKKETSNPFTL